MNPLALVAVVVAGKLLDWCDWAPTGADAFFWLALSCCGAIMAARGQVSGLLILFCAADPAISAYVHSIMGP